MQGQVGPCQGGVAKQFPMFSFYHGACRNKMASIFKCCTASLQDGSPRDCPLFRVVNLEALDSSPGQPRKRRILKFDLDVRWNKSEKWVTLQSGAHMDNCSRSHLSPPDSTGVGELEFLGS